jgi:hypothetical protein
MKRNTEYFFTINVSYQDCLRLYSGNKKHVVIIDEAGVKVSLPIHNIKPFITRVGINGRFHLTLSEHQKIKDFTQIS